MSKDKEKGQEQSKTWVQEKELGIFQNQITKVCANLIICVNYFQDGK